MRHGAGNPRARTAFLYHDFFLEHHTGWKHPEKSARLTAVMDRLRTDGLLDRVLRLTPVEATPETVALVHDPAYVADIEARGAAGRLFQADADTVGSPATYRAALLAVGAVTAAIDAVFDGTAQNAFCAVRPPGHHAEHDRAMGFCFFNNVAIGALHARQRRAVSRVAIVDWDVHHGNGTQNAFYADPSVLYVSTHQFPLYPGSGRRSETGEGPGLGFNLNIPLAAGSTDTDYLAAFRDEIRPAIARFKPDLILVSAGFDGHRDDPLASMRLTEQGFADMTRELTALAATHCGCRLVSVLEGGYHLPALAAAVSAHIAALLEASA